MLAKFKNVIIFLVVLGVLVTLYFIFMGGGDEEAGLVSTTPSASTAAPAESAQNALGSRDFLTLLLSVKNIKLADSILSDIRFQTLRDSSITLVPDTSEGRPNPFAPLGSEARSSPASPGSAQPPAPAGSAAAGKPN